MPKKVNLLSTLYTGSRNLTCAPISVNTRGPRGLYLSAAGIAAGSSAAKISYAAVIFDYLFDKRIAAIEIPASDAVYCELYDKDGVMTDAVMVQNGSVGHWANAEPTHSSHIVFPFIMYALSSFSKMEEFKLLFSQCASEFISGGVISNDNLYKCCDAFYYEWKTHYPDAVDTNAALDFNVIRQAVRTRNAQPMLEDYSTYMRDISVAPMPKEETKEEPAKDDSEKYAACKRGDYDLGIFVELENKPLVPSRSMLDGFVPNDTFFDLVDIINNNHKRVMARLDVGEYGLNAIGNDYLNLQLVGKPGTGKTTLINAVAATLGMPVHVVTVSENTEEDTFQGMNKIVEGSLKFVETSFVKGYEGPFIILIEEVNLAKAAVLMGAIGQAIEKPFILEKDGYQQVHRHPLCVVVATMNTGTQGSKEPNEAFASRFPYVFTLDDPAEEQFVDVLVKDGHEKSDALKVYKAYSKLIKYLESPEINAEDVAMSLTMRHCLAALRLMRDGFAFKKAIKNTMIGAIAVKDMILARKVYDSVKEPMAA